MKEIQERYRIWTKDGWEFRTGTILAAENGVEAAALERAAENTGYIVGHGYYPTEVSLDGLTTQALEEVKKALVDPKPTRQEIQNARTFGRFLDRLSPNSDD